MKETEQKEYVNSIREQYEERGTTKIDELRALDRKVKLPPAVFAYTFGILGALLLGTGMCLTMQVIGTGLLFAKPLGVAIGIVGIAVIGANYPVYAAVLKSRKRKYAQQIMAISGDLLNET